MGALRPRLLSLWLFLLLLLAGLHPSAANAAPIGASPASQLLVSVRGGARGGRNGFLAASALIRPKAGRKKARKVSKALRATPCASQSSSALAPRLEDIAKRQQLLVTALQLVSSVLSILAPKYIFKLDFKDHKVLRLARGLFAAYLVAAHIFYAAMRFTIAAADDDSMLAESPSSGPLSSLLSGLDGVDSSSQSTISSLLKKLAPQKARTVRQHDNQHNERIYQSLLMELAIATILHFVFKRHSVLLMIPLMGVLKRLQEPLVLIHFFRLQPVGSLQRPFKSSIEIMLSQMTDKPESASSGGIQVERTRIEPSAGLQAQKGDDDSSSAVDSLIDNLDRLAEGGSEGEGEGEGEEGEEEEEEEVDLDEDPSQR